MKTALLLTALALAGCGPKNGGGSDAGTDAGTDAGQLISACGMPGDPGNSLGVGQFCQFQGDCTHSMTICSSLVNDPAMQQNNTYVCVLQCDPCTDPPGFCGSNASCVCELALGGCGCFPDACSAFAMRVGTPKMCSDGGTDGGTTDAGVTDGGQPDGGATDGGDAG